VRRRFRQDLLGCSDDALHPLQVTGAFRMGEREKEEEPLIGAGQGVVVSDPEALLGKATEPSASEEKASGAPA
jgi:hypothetical protein